MVSDAGEMAGVLIVICIPPLVYVTVTQGKFKGLQ
jgi:hypothetical protein